MGIASFLTTAALAVSAAAQFVSYSSGDYSISVNVPSDTASSKSGSIYFQIAAPSGLQWVSFGQGSRMSGANMFVLYSSGSGITLSPRSASGHNMPTFSSDIQASLLDGSEIKSDGSMIANIKCDSCLSWSGGSMDPTSSKSNWIFAYKTGDALNTNDQSASISQHDSHSSFTLDLTQGTGGNSNNPFVAAAASSSDSGSAAATSTTAVAGSTSATASTTQAGQTSTKAQSTTHSTVTALSSASQPIASSNPSNQGSSSQSSITKTPSNSPYAHGVLMSILFLGFFPLFALTLYLPTTKKVRFIHAPLQMLSVILLIVGMALGIVYGKNINELDGYHQVIGYIVVAIMVLAQPAMGIYQHLNYHRTGSRSVIGRAHQSIGRVTIALGIINGGIGWSLTSTTGAYVPYAVVAAIVFLIYVAVVVMDTMKQRRAAGYPNDKSLPAERRGYEMHGTKEARSTVMTR